MQLQDGETLGMDYSATTDSDQFSAMTSLSEKDYYIQPSKFFFYIFRKTLNQLLVLDYNFVKMSLLLTLRLFLLLFLQLQWATPQQA